MRCLIVNPDTESTWELPLQTGIATLGRQAGNELVLDHPSIADHHCQFMVMDAVVTVKDLGSGRGTYVQGQPVEEAELADGQTLQLGEVRLRYEARATAPVASVSGTPPAAAHCKLHPRSLARFACPQCQSTFCERCVSSRFAEGRQKVICRTCAVECTALEVALDLPAEERPFTAQATEAFKYPLQGDGVILIVTGAIFLLLIKGALSVVAYSFLYGFTAMGFLTVFGVGYLSAYMRRIVTSTACGEDKMPDWPDISDFGSDVREPFWQFVVMVIFCFAPPLALTLYAFFYAGSGDTSWLGGATMALMLFSCLYFPMAFLAVAMYNTVAALNPLLIIPSVLKVWRAYGITILLLATVLVLRWVSEHFLPKLIPIPLLPTILCGILGLYLLVVEVRILGLLYRTNKHELGWFT